jgi:hypothetical protein
VHDLCDPDDQFTAEKRERRGVKKEDLPAGVRITNRSEALVFPARLTLKLPV